MKVYGTKFRLIQSQVLCLIVFNPVRKSLQVILYFIQDFINLKIIHRRKLNFSQCALRVVIVYNTYMKIIIL